MPSCGRHPAFPVHSIRAKSSVVLSHQTDGGWKPKLLLNVPGELLLAVRDHDGGVDIQHDHVTKVCAGDRHRHRDDRHRHREPASLLASCAQTWRRTRPLAVWIPFIAAGVSSSSARHTVGVDATGPSTGAWWRSTSMSEIATESISASAASCLRPR